MNKRTPDQSETAGCARDTRATASHLDWRLGLLCLVGLVLALLAASSLRTGSNDSVPAFTHFKGPPPEPLIGVRGPRSPVLASWYGATGAVNSVMESGAAGGARHPPDAVLVKSTGRGETQAFEELVRRYIRSAHGVAMTIVKSPDLADDVCQEAFLSALRNIEQCRHPEKFRAWFLTIVRNRALNVMASEALRSGPPLETAGQFASPDDPQRDLERKEFIEQFQGAVERLSGLNRDVFVLHDVKGWTHAEIATELGISKVASRVHLHYARQSLKVSLDHQVMTEV